MTTTTDTAALTELIAKLDTILAQNHAILRQLGRTATPVDLVDTEEAARRAGVSGKTLHRLAALGVFTDGRPPEKRSKQCPRRWYADECVVYRSEGEDGVRRLREEWGRI